MKRILLCLALAGFCVAPFLQQRECVQAEEPPLAPVAKLTGPRAVEVGAPIVLNPSGSVAPDGYEFGVASGPGEAPVITLASADGKTVIGFGTAAKEGAYVFYVIAWGKASTGRPPHAIAFWSVQVGALPPPKPVDPKPTDPPGPNKVTAVTYVYEKDQHAIPNQILAAMNKLNREFGIVATLLDVDTKSGTGGVPEQYKPAFAAAKEAGLPALVVTGDGKVLRTVKNPTTEQAVMEAIK